MEKEYGNQSINQSKALFAVDRNATAYNTKVTIKNNRQYL